MSANSIDSDQYVDGSIDGEHVSATGNYAFFGTRTKNDTTPATLVVDTTYKAQCDGFLTVWNDENAGSTDWIKVFASATKNDVDTEAASAVIAWHEAGNSAGSGGCYCVTVPIPKNDYVRVDTLETETCVIIWQPIGAGGLVDQS